MTLTNTERDAEMTKTSISLPNGRTGRIVYFKVEDGNVYPVRYKGGLIDPKTGNSLVDDSDTYGAAMFLSDTVYLELHTPEGWRTRDVEDWHKPDQKSWYFEPNSRLAEIIEEELDETDDNWDEEQIQIVLWPEVA